MSVLTPISPSWRPVTNPRRATLLQLTNDGEVHGRRPHRAGSSGCLPPTMLLCVGSSSPGRLVAWTGGAPSSIPRRAGCPGAKEPAMPRKSKDTAAVLGIDIGKNVFHLIGLDNKGAIVLRQKLSRGQLEATACQHATLPRQPWLPITSAKRVPSCACETDDSSDLCRVARLISHLAALRASLRACRLLMLWTAPPPARKCQGCGCC